MIGKTKINRKIEIKVNTLQIVQITGNYGKSTTDYQIDKIRYCRTDRFIMYQKSKERQLNKDTE